MDASLEDRHLGDGVYAICEDDYHVILEYRSPSRTTRIALTPAMLAELQRFLRDVADAKNGMAPCH